MENQIEREVWVKQDKLKNPVHYVRGTDLLPIVFHFRDFSIPSAATARVFVAKPDGNAVYDSATIEGNDVTVDVTEQMFLVLGVTLMQISIMDGEEELVSFVQPVDVQQNLKAGDLPASTTDVKFLDEAIEQANEAVNTATTAAQQAATAVQNANQAIEDANDAISDLNAQIASLNTNFASLANNVSISQLDTTAKTLVGAIDELNSKSKGYILGITVISTDTLKFKGRFDSNTLGEGDRQSVLMFGDANARTVHGVLRIYGNGTVQWRGYVQNGEVTASMDSKGIISVNLPEVAYDTFCLVSAQRITAV